MILQEAKAPNALFINSFDKKENLYAENVVFIFFFIVFKKEDTNWAVFFGEWSCQVSDNSPLSLGENNLIPISSFYCTESVTTNEGILPVLFILFLK